MRLDAVRTARAQLLIRMPAGAAKAISPLKIAIGTDGPHLRPLFENTPRPRAGLAANGSQEWYIADLGAAGLTNAQLWEATHRARSSRALTAAAGTVFVEPDLVQSWPYENTVRSSVGPSAAPGELCEFNNQNADFPEGHSFAWHLASTHSQLADANANVSGNAVVRIGILDTGIDLTHDARPGNLALNLARNFIDDQEPNNVSDPFVRGLFNNPGHGTGTIGLLAGQRYRTANGGGFDGAIGGAPWAQIIPVRIATSVILFRTSTFAQGLDYLIAPNGDAAQRAHVVSMSMGGLASKAWADVVNRAYDAGIVIVTAAGNNYPLTPSMIVYPALFRRVIAACGAMADGRPYIREEVPFGAMAGNYGPAVKMTTALSAYTPNTPWAEVNCKAIVDMNGAGTSSATPQIAAAAALYLRHHATELAQRQPWEVVEIVRSALFGSAKAPSDPKYVKALGQGILQANAALSVPVAQRVQKTPEDSADFALLRGLLGTGIATSPELEGLELELAQVIQRDPGLAAHYMELGLSGQPLTATDARKLVDVVVSQTEASTSLKSALKRVYPTQYVTASPSPREATPTVWEAQVRDPKRPTRRRLRGYAFDPQVSSEFATASVAATTYHIRWEPLLAGPVGEYLEVVDYDPASGGFYQPVDLEASNLLATDGFPPSEGNPLFHQQMVYAVIMRTIETFETALGRRVLWSPNMKGSDDSEFVQRLRVYPHAFRERNAYYDPTRKALLFGYFTASGEDPGIVYPGGMVFTCLSHDIVAHETTHAILDGMHRGFMVASNQDVLAFHEAFADIVALLQHFSLPGVLEQQLAKARGDLRARTLLGALAVQFGMATGAHGALRSAIGQIDPQTGQWEVLQARPTQLDEVVEPHDRGAILVAALFDAFLTIYDSRTADLLRIATGGTGVLPAGDLPPDLTRRLAKDAGKVAGQLLRMCVRALDYCPPVDITFGDYLRALITADTIAEPEDELNYRIAIVDAFRRRGIYPKGLRSIASDTLVWDSPNPRFMDLLRDDVKRLVPLLDELSHIDPSSRDARYEQFKALHKWRQTIHDVLRNRFDTLSEEDRALLSRTTGLNFAPGYARFEVRNVQVAQRQTADGRFEPQMIISIVQRIRVDVPSPDELPSLADGANDEAGEGKEPVPRAPLQSTSFSFQGGCTLIFNPRTGMVEYVVRKNINSASRQAEETRFRAASAQSSFNTYFDGASEANLARAFALVHSASQES